MVSTVLSCLVCVSCVVVAFAEDCSSYYDAFGNFHTTQFCGRFCCGSCNQKYCCSFESSRFTKADQKRCPERPTYGNNNYGNNNYKLNHGNNHSAAMIAGTVIGAIIQISMCVGLIICCVAPCCWCYKKCRNGRNRRQTNAVTTTTTVVYSPQQPFSPPGYQQSHPGYQAVPVHAGSAMPTRPPPSYLESIGPGHPPAAFDQGQPMYPLQPPSQHYAPPLHSDELVSPPYNPSYTPNT